MINLQEKSQEISERLKELRVNLEVQRESVMRDMDENAEGMKAALAMGDTSENAAYTEAVDKASALSVQLANIMQQIAEIDNIKGEDNYVPIDAVVMFSTVLISIDGKETVLKLYPGVVSDIEQGILAAECPVGKLIWQKKVGDTFNVTHRVTGKKVEYRILGVY